MNFFKKTMLSGILLVAVFSLAACDGNMGNLFGLKEKTLEQTIADSIKTRQGMVQKLSCADQYQNILKYNNMDLGSCTVEVRTGEFKESEPTKPQKQNNMVLIFDSSGSMAQMVGGKKKIDIAKEATWNFINKMNGSNINLSIIVYGHKGSNSPSQKALSCTGIDEVYYMNSIHAEVAKGKVNAFQPTGWTPIANSFKKAAEILSKYQGDAYNNSILLISDGKETCDGNPINVAKELKNSGMNVTANVIGFDVGGEDEKQLQEIAKNGAGEYFPAKSVADFELAMQKHEAFMAKFDYKMQRFTEQLDDAVLIGNTYFECLTRLKQQEALMMLDIYADKIVSDKCSGEVEKMYYTYYDDLKKTLDGKYEKGKKTWQDNSQFSK